MKFKKIILGIFFLLLFSSPIQFIFINRNLFETEIIDKSVKRPNISNSITKTVILRPNEDILTEWDGSPTPHWSKLDEETPDSTYVTWVDGDENQTEIFGMEDLDTLNINVTKVRVYMRGFRFYTGAPNVSIYLGEWTPEIEVLISTSPVEVDKWRSCEWDNLNGTYQDLRDLQVKIKAGTWCSTDGYCRIDTLYCLITYDILEITGDTAIVRPNEDILTEWDGSPTPHWSRLDEEIPDSTYVTWINGDANQSEIFGMQSLYFENAIITNVQVYMRGFRYWTGTPNVSIYLGEWTPEIEVVIDTNYERWRSCEWDNLNGTYQDLINLQVKIKAGTWCSADGYCEINTLYCVITLENPLTILSPENKTYLEPLSGYYPATHGFDNDNDGDDPEGWVILHENPTAEVISKLYGHNKVLRLNDTVGASGKPTKVYNNFTKKDYGTVEVWMLQDTLGFNDLGQITGWGNGNQVFGVKMWGGTTPTWKARDNGTDVEILAPTPTINTWYHIRIDFEHTIGGYQGLGENEYYVYIDGSRYGPYLFDINNQVDELHLHTYSYGAWYNTYFDAVGYSWDPAYDVGDNLNEGMLLSFESNITLDWIAYSLDGQGNKTIFEQEIIPMPEEYSHTIQIFGNDSLGNIYFTEIRQFMVDTTAPISLISFTPYSGTNKVNKSTEFTITADDGIGSGISSIKYKINNSIWFDYSVPFDLSSYDYGDYLISYYAIDLAGHIEVENTLLVELVKEPSVPPPIPGYDVILLISIICVVSVILFKIRYKFLKK